MGLQILNSYINSNPNLNTFFNYENEEVFTYTKEDGLGADADANAVKFCDSPEGFPTSEEMDSLLLIKAYENYHSNAKSYLQDITSPSHEIKAVSLALKTLNEQNIALNDEILARPALNAHNFTNWTLARNLCTDEIIQWNSKLLYNLKIRKINPLDNPTSNLNYDKEVLTHLFNETAKNFNEIQRNQIIEIKNSIQIKSKDISTIITIGYSLSNVLEKTINISVKIFSSGIFKFFAYFAIYFYMSTYIDQIFTIANTTAVFYGMPKVINYVPVSLINTALTISEYKISIFLSLYVVSKITKSPILTILVLKPIHCIFFLPQRLTLIFADIIMDKSKFVGAKIQFFQKKWTDLRLGYELVEARELWIQSYQAERTNYRKQFAT